jgi:hypothetical protein
MSALTESGCAPGVNLIETVGSGGGALLISSLAPRGGIIK